MPKQCELCKQVKEMVDAEYVKGRNTVMGDEELLKMIRTADADAYARFEAIYHQKG